MEEKFKDVKKERVCSIVLGLIGCILGIILCVAYIKEIITISYFLYLLIIMGLIVVIMYSYIMFARIRRYYKYKEYIGNRKQVKVEDLKSLFKKQKIKRLVVSDLEYYIKKGWLIQGHLVDIRRLLIMDDVSYKKYMEKMERE